MAEAKQNGLAGLGMNWTDLNDAGESLSSGGVQIHGRELGACGGGDRFMRLGRTDLADCRRHG
jgi:hypothetical protein